MRFLVPAARFPFRIQFDEESIKVRFQGPVQEIRRLRERVKDPDFSLAVAVPPPGAEGEQTIPFAEDNLLLYGFRRVQILQHPLRQAQGGVGVRAVSRRPFRNRGQLRTGFGFDFRLAPG